MGVYERKIKRRKDVFSVTDSIEYIVWFHRVFGTSLKSHKALDYYGSCEELYRAVMSGNDTSGLTVGMPSSRYEAFSILDARKIVDLCEEKGWDIIPHNSELYPAELKSIGNYPVMLFAHGKKDVLTRPVKAAIVGSREADEVARKIAYNAAFNLSKTGITVISGAALGIDSCAHLGAVDGAGETIGILGCGLGSSYMDRIGDFYDKVMEHGVYITEMFPFENASKYTFPERNRLISGMSRAVLVACASEKSGSLTTAAKAKKQNRRVYAVAPEIYRSKGCEQLLMNGAYYFYNAGDIAYPLREHIPPDSFNEYYCNRPVSASFCNVQNDNTVTAVRKKDSLFSQSSAESIISRAKAAAAAKKETEAPEKNKELPDTVSDNAKRIYSVLGNEPVQRDSLVSLTGLRIPQVLSSISELETFGFIKTLPGGRVEKKS